MPEGMNQPDLACAGQQQQPRVSAWLSQLTSTRFAFSLSAAGPPAAPCAMLLLNSTNSRQHRARRQAMAGLQGVRAFQIG